MTLDELRQEWQAMKFPKPSDDDIRRIIYAKRAWRVKRLTTKDIFRMVIDFLFIIAVIIFGLKNYDGWTTAMLTIWCICMYFDHYLSVRYLFFFSTQKVLTKEKLTKAISQIKVMRVLRIMYVVIWITAAIVLGLHVPIGPANVFLWALILLPALFGVNWWSTRTWKRKKMSSNGCLRFVENRAEKWRR